MLSSVHPPSADHSFRSSTPRSAQGSSPSFSNPSPATTPATSAFARSICRTAAARRADPTSPSRAKNTHLSSAFSSSLTRKRGSSALRMLLLERSSYIISRTKRMAQLRLHLALQPPARGLAQLRRQAATSADARAPPSTGAGSSVARARTAGFHPPTSSSPLPSPRTRQCPPHAASTSSRADGRRMSSPPPYPLRSPPTLLSAR